MKGSAGKGGSGSKPAQSVPTAKVQAPSNPSVQSAASKVYSPPPSSGGTRMATPTPTAIKAAAAKAAGAGQRYEERKPNIGYRPPAPTPPRIIKPPSGGKPSPPPKSPRPPVPPKPPSVVSDPPRPLDPEPSYPTPDPDIPISIQTTSYGYSDPPPPEPVPADPWIRSSTYVAPVGIKQADPDIVLFDTESISPEYLLELEYESLSGMELINISRSDIVDGQDVVYSPIKNLSLIRRRYNPNNIINLSELSASFFSRFAIDLVQRGMKKPYFDNEGNLVIEIEDVRNDEVIEVEIDTNATIEEVILA